MTQRITPGPWRWARALAIGCALLGGGLVPAAREPQSRGVIGDRAPSAPRSTPPPVIRVPATIRVGVAGAAKYSIKSVDIEEYVAGVLTGEAARDSDPAVLQALAIAIRTYAMKNLNRHRADGFDICDETHCQVWRKPTPATTSAASRTAGQVLTWRGALAIVYYSASCGGHSQIPSAVWVGAEDPPYLPSRADVGCGGDPLWSIDFRTADLERTLRDAGFRGSLQRLRVLSRDRSGRVRHVAVDGMRPASIAGADLRMALGPTLIKSTAFELRPGVAGYAFSGHGYGHGVGMCVIGATRLAARGETAEALLARYYPGTVLGRIDTGNGIGREGVTASAPASPPVPAPVGKPPAPTAAPASAVSPAAPAVPDVPVDPAAGDRRELATLTETARTELSAVLGLTAAVTVPVVAHLTDSAYERASGRPWFTLGAYTAGQIHLMPLEQLRQRGMLERTLRREVAHTLIDDRLRGRPQWVRDGLALYYATPQAAPAAASGPCPNDADLLRPPSAGALAHAYALARACVARQLAGGRPWADVR